MHELAIGLHTLNDMRLGRLRARGRNAGSAFVGNGVVSRISQSAKSYPADICVLLCPSSLVGIIGCCGYCLSSVNFVMELFIDSEETAKSDLN